MKCSLCGENVLKSIDTIEKRLKNDILFNVINVPVEVCKKCGEIYIDQKEVVIINKIIDCLNNSLFEIREKIVLDFNIFKKQKNRQNKKTFIGFQLNNRYGFPQEYFYKLLNFGLISVIKQSTLNYGVPNYEKINTNILIGKKFTGQLSDDFIFEIKKILIELKIPYFNKLYCFLV